MSSDPTDVCRAPVHVIGLVVKHQLEGDGGVEHVAANGVKNPLGEKEGQTPGACVGILQHQEGQPPWASQWSHWCRG